MPALFKNMGGYKNTAIGVRALFNNTTGIDNVAIGLAAGRNLTTGQPLGRSHSSTKETLTPIALYSSVS
jgi:hypothetical protein